VSAVAPGRALGLYPASSFRLTDGRCRDCPTVRQALWYFERETIAVPVTNQPIAGFAKGVRAIDDIEAWSSTRTDNAPLDFPPLVWIAAPQVFDQARLLDGNGLAFGDAPPIPLRLTPRIALNRAYFDESSTAFFAQRTIKVRGTRDDGAIVARTLWPEDFRLDSTPPWHGLDRNVVRTKALRALVRAEPRGGAQSSFATFTLWQRKEEAADAPVTSGRPVIGLLLNGAQGDDDEAHAGHFALITGRTREDGAIGDWLVNNFYSLDIESEKGIIAAPVPLDNYLADLNSGQGYYRPSYLIVAVLRDERAPVLLQNALNRVYNQFYRHQLEYRHATMNCASISVDVLRALGWDIAARGASNRVLAAIGFPYFLATERSLAKAKTMYDYLVEDQTRLMPAATFEEIGASLLALVEDPGVGTSDSDTDRGPLARMVAADTETIVFVRFPQFPSSRAFGDAPAVTMAEYQARLPSDRAAMQIVPVPPRPFPSELRDPDLLSPPRQPSDTAVMVWAFIVLCGIAWLAWRL
jgi:hypothetical protein